MADYTELPSFEQYLIDEGKIGNTMRSAAMAAMMGLGSHGYTNAENYTSDDDPSDKTEYASKDSDRTHANDTIYPYWEDEGGTKRHQEKVKNERMNIKGRQDFQDYENDKTSNLKYIEYIRPFAKGGIKNKISFNNLYFGHYKIQSNTDDFFLGKNDKKELKNYLTLCKYYSNVLAKMYIDAKNDETNDSRFVFAILKDAGSGKFIIINDAAGIKCDGNDISKFLRKLTASGLYEIEQVGNSNSSLEDMMSKSKKVYNETETVYVRIIPNFNEETVYDEKEYRKMRKELDDYEGNVRRLSN